MSMAKAGRRGVTLKQQVSIAQMGTCTRVACPKNKLGEGRGKPYQSSPLLPIGEGPFLYSIAHALNAKGPKFNPWSLQLKVLTWKVM